MTLTVMKYLSLSLLLLLFNSLSGFGQSVKVIDNTDLQPVPDVFIFSSTVSSLTDAKGWADLSDFGKNDTLYFQHPSYIHERLTLEAISKSGGVVRLKEDLLRVNEIVVSQNRWEQNKGEIPNKIEAIRSKDVSFYNPQTTADLVGLSDQVFIQKSQQGGGSPMIRGFSANRVLLAMDGVRMNNAIFRSGNLQNVIMFDPNIMDNSEVIFGPGSIIYGSDAIGGVMDFHTRQVKLSTTDDAYLRLNALTRFSTASLEKTGHLDFSYGKNKWGMLSSISFSDYNDLRMGSVGDDFYVLPVYVQVYAYHDSVMKNSEPNIQLGSGYSQVNMMQKFRFRPSETIDLTYALHYSRSSDIPRYDRSLEISDGIPKYAEWYYGPSQWLMHHLGAELKDTTPFFDRLKLTLAYQTYSESRYDRKFGQTLLRERQEYLDIVNFNLDADKIILDNKELFYGLEWSANRINSTGNGIDIYSGEQSLVSSRYPDGGTLYISSGIYAGLKNRLSDKLILSTGIRANYVYLNSLFISKEFFDFPYDQIQISNSAFNGSAGVAWHPMESWQINLNLSSGFRAPNLDDVGKVFDSEPGIVIVPNEDLKPEYALNADIGVIKKFGDKAKFEFTGFYTYLFNAMVRRDYTFSDQSYIMYDEEFSRVEAIVNADQAIVYGFSAALNWNFFTHFYLRSSFTATHGEESGGIPMRHAAPMFGATHLIFQTGKLRSDLFVRYNGAKTSDQMAPSELNKTYLYTSDENGDLYSPAWYTLNFNLAYQIKPFLQVNLGVENIMDVRYRPYSSGIAAPGRNFMVTIRTSI